MKRSILFLLSFAVCMNVIGQWSTSGTNIYNTNTGNVGIGTSAPAQRLHINGTALVTAENNGLIVDEGTNRRVGLMKYSGRQAGLWRVQDLNFEIGRVNVTSLPGSPTTFTTDLFITGAGDVGIGTTDPKGYKLAVNGKGIFTELKVKLYANWPDYVFDKSYHRLSLTNLEEFINKNNHLPNIPSAQEVKDAGGIELGIMNAKLLEKIEELTLYVIDLKKENDAVKEKMEKLAVELSALKGK